MYSSICLYPDGIRTQYMLLGQETILAPLEHSKSTGLIDIMQKWGMSILSSSNLLLWYVHWLASSTLDLNNIPKQTRDLAFKALGWSIRYFMVLRDNYLGSFTHFSTLFEYLDKKRRNLPPGDPIALKYREGKVSRIPGLIELTCLNRYQANMLQVELALFAEHSAILLPAGIPGCETSTHLQEDSGDAGIGACLVLDVPELQVQFRMHDYYMGRYHLVLSTRPQTERHSPRRYVSQC